MVGLGASALNSRRTASGAMSARRGELGLGEPQLIATIVKCSHQPIDLVDAAACFVVRLAELRGRRARRSTVQRPFSSAAPCAERNTKVTMHHSEFGTFRIERERHLRQQPLEIVVQDHDASAEPPRTESPRGARTRTQSNGRYRAMRRPRRRCRSVGGWRPVPVGSTDSRVAGALRCGRGVGGAARMIDVRFMVPIVRKEDSSNHSHDHTHDHYHRRPSRVAMTHSDHSLPQVSASPTHTTAHTRR